MNAIEFVRKFGIKQAKMNIDFLENRSRVESYSKKLMLNDLKQIVEAFELVEFYGGYDLAKNVTQITPLQKESYDLIENLKNP